MYSRSFFMASHSYGSKTWRQCHCRDCQTECVCRFCNILRHILTYTFEKIYINVNDFKSFSVDFFLFKNYLKFLPVDPFFLFVDNKLDILLDNLIAELICHLKLVILRKIRSEKKMLFFIVNLRMRNSSRLTVVVEEVVILIS